MRKLLTLLLTAATLSVAAQIQPGLPKRSPGANMVQDSAWRAGQILLPASPNLSLGAYADRAGQSFQFRTSNNRLSLRGINQWVEFPSFVEVQSMIGAISSGTLQSVTTGSGKNITSNTIKVNGADNYSTANGVQLFDSPSYGGFERHKGAGLIAGLYLYDDFITLGLSAGTTFRINKTETGSVPGIKTLSRMEGFDAVNSSEFTTLSQVQGLIPATITANNGLTKTGNNIALGGILTGSTVIGQDAFSSGYLEMSTTLMRGRVRPASGSNVNDGGQFSATSTGSSISWVTGGNIMAIGAGSTNGLAVTDAVNSRGMRYSFDYSVAGKPSNRWIPDWGAVKARVDSTGVLKQNLVTLTTTGSGAATFNQSTGALNIPTSIIASGTYTPTIAIIEDFTVATSAGVAHYMRIGNEVTVNGSINATATSIARGEFTITLPIASNMTAAEDLFGQATHSTPIETLSANAIISPDTSTDVASVSINTVNGSYKVFYQFMYTVK